MRIFEVKKFDLKNRKQVPDRRYLPYQIEVKNEFKKICIQYLTQGWNVKA